LKENWWFSFFWVVVFGGFLFFLVYLVLGLAVIFWKELPLAMEFKYRIALGVLLIVYSIIRFQRFYNSNK
jgi:nitrate/nitrite transporter NarK